MRFRLVPKSSTLDGVELLYVRILTQDCRAVTFALARLSCFHNDVGLSACLSVVVQWCRGSKVVPLLQTIFCRMYRSVSTHSENNKLTIFLPRQLSELKHMQHRVLAQSANAKVKVKLLSYPNVLFVANLSSLKDRRDKFSGTFFQNMCKPASCLHHFLSPPRNTSAISRLRSSTPLPRRSSRTKKFESFVNFALNKYQSPL